MARIGAACSACSLPPCGGGSGWGVVRSCMAVPRCTTPTPSPSPHGGGGPAGPGAGFCINRVRAKSIRRQRAAAVLEGAERLVGRDRAPELVELPWAFRPRRPLGLKKVHWVDLAPVDADRALAEQGVVGRHRLHGGDDGVAVGRPGDL